MTEPAAGVKRPKGIQSVEVGYRVLLAVQRGPSPVQLTEIARRAGLSTGAAHNYLVSLQRTGLVESEERGAYRLGPSAFALSLASFEQLSHYDVMRDSTRRLNQQLGTSTAASVWSQAGPVSVYQLYSDAFGSFEFRSGLLPFLNAAAPRVFMAFLPKETTLPVMREELKRRRRPESEAEALLAGFAKSVRDLGYAVTSYAGDYGDDIAAIAAPVFDAQKQIVFALTIMGIANRIRPDVDAAICNSLLAEASLASSVMGLVDHRGLPRFE